MAGSAVLTTYDREHILARFQIDWTSDASGAVSGTNFTFIRGTIIAVGFTPGSDGNQPTNLYDLTLMCDRHNSDLLNGAGADLSNSVGEHRGVFIETPDKSAFSRQWCHGGLYQLVVANAGDTNTGSVDLYIYYGVL